MRTGPGRPVFAIWKASLKMRGMSSAFFYEISVLDERGNCACDIYFLKNIPPKQITLYLTGDGNERDTVHVSGGDASDQIGGSRTRCYDADTSFASDAGIARCHMGSALFLPHKNMLNRFTVI